MRILFDQGTPSPFTGRRLAIIVLLSTSWPRIERAGEAVVAAVRAAGAGSFQEIQIPE